MTAPPANESGGGCCVPGCDSDAFHTQTFTIAVGGWGGEIETSSHFCCAHSWYPWPNTARACGLI